MSCNHFYSKRKKIKINFKNIVHLNFIKEASILKKINQKGYPFFVYVLTEQGKSLQHSGGSFASAN